MEHVNPENALFLNAKSSANNVFFVSKCLDNSLYNEKPENSAVREGSKIYTMRRF